MSALDGRPSRPVLGTLTPDPDCVPRPCKVCGRDVVLAWTGQHGRTLRPVTVDAHLFGVDLTAHRCDG